MIDQASLVIGNGNWAVKSDSLLGYKLIDGKYYPRQMSATRATTATRVNSAGLVELVPYNLVEYSQEITNVVWVLQNGGGTASAVITANYGIAPDGTMTADRLQLNKGNTGYAEIYQYPISTISGGTYTFSAYVKSLSGNVSFLFGFNGSAREIKNATTEWTRITWTTSATSTASAPAISLVDSYDPNTSSSVDLLVWGFQIVEGSVAKDYFPTTDRLDLARIDYSSASPALLAEPQRTNSCLYSEDLTNAYWNKFNSSISANATTAPNGIATADKVIENTSNSFHYVESTNSLINGNTYSISCFLKKAEREYGYIGVYTFESKQIRVNLNDGTITSTAGTWLSTSVEDYGNGWYRVIGTFSASSTTYFFTGPALDGNTPTYTGDGTSGIYIWGVQLEAGSYATSYIPTTSASVTRNADVLTYSSLNSLDITKPNTFSWFLDLGDETIVNNFDIRLGGIGLYVIGTGGQGTQWSLYNFTSFNQILSNTNITSNRKICLTYNSGVLKVFANNQLLTTYSGSIASDTLTFLMSNADNRLVLNTLAIFNTTLSDTDALNLIS